MIAARSICPVCGVRLHAGSTADLAALTAAHNLSGCHPHSRPPRTPTG